MVQTAVSRAMETYIQNMKSLSSCQRESNDIYNTMNAEEPGKLRGKRKSVECSIHRHHYYSKTKTYHFWFGEIRMKTFKCDLSNESSHHEQTSNTCESLWHTKILVLPAPWILRKGTLVALGYITRETRKTSLQTNIEPIRVISEDSPVFRACFKGDFIVVRQLIEGGQASRHDRDEVGWTLLERTLHGISFESREPNRTRDAEDLLDFLISIGINPSQESKIFFFVCRTKSGRDKQLFY